MVSDAPALSKRERLELILQKEKDRLENKKHVKHTPAQYRKLLLSTSNRTIGTTKETNKKPVVKKSATPTSLRVVSSAENKKREKMETVKSLLFDAPDGYQSVFQGKRPSKTAVAMRTAKEKSAWAKIAQFEQYMYSLQVKAEKLAKLKTIKEKASTSTFRSRSGRSSLRSSPRPGKWRRRASPVRSKSSSTRRR